MKTIKKPLITLLFLVFVLSLVLAGCAGEKEPKINTNGNESDSNASVEDKVVLDFWTFWGSEVRKPIVEKIISDFNESQDEIEVKHTYFPFGDIWTKSLASITAGKIGRAHV